MGSRNMLYIFVFRASSRVHIFHLNAICFEAARSAALHAPVNTRDDDSALTARAGLAEPPPKRDGTNGAGSQHDW
jgi:hypothetical protein